ncbi:MAG: Rieske (2Fe-2S) protein [Myxococcales bacterium]|nr:Rieske (2Fe-2S) protein [Myxococcales bacterium]MCB9644618.1 Rieske (2Fe-2S) protein [Myxococcales bacterium]
MKEKRCCGCSALEEKDFLLEGQEGVTRREALERLGKAALWVSSGALWGVGCVKQVAYEAKLEGGGAWVPQDKLITLKDAQAVLSLGVGLGRPVYLRKIPKDGYLALLSRCSHRGCEVDAEPDGYECPCHSARFDVQGRRLAGPARRGLTRFPVVVKEGGVWIDLHRGNAQ